MLLIVIWTLIFCKAEKDMWLIKAIKVYAGISIAVIALSLYVQRAELLIMYVFETIIIYFLYKIFKDTIQKYL